MLFDLNGEKKFCNNSNTYKLNPSERDFLFYLEDMSVSIRKIVEAVKDIPDYEALENEWMRYDAVLRNLEVIGEAARQVPDSIKETYAEIPWNDMYRTRNILIHQYFGVDAQIIWRIVTVHLPQNLPAIEQMIEDYRS